MSEKFHLNHRTAAFLLLFLLLNFDSYYCDAEFDELNKKVEKICKSKSNELKDERINCRGKPSCQREFTKRTSCWEKTCAGEKATAPCPMLFFRTNAVVDAFCDHDGKWNFTNTNYKKCKSLTTEERNKIVNELLRTDTQKEDLTLKVYVIFSWISLSFMIPSLFILFYFMDKKNIRFNFHKNLICAFLFRVVTFFIDHYGDLTKGDRTTCNVFWILNRFFAVSEVAWMLNEAVYLLKLLFRTFDAKSYFWRFFAFGWGFPAMLVLAVYIPVMVYYVDAEMKICWIKEKDSYYMFTLYGPMTLMLVINFATLIYVIYVLLDKLRTSTTSELLRLKKGIKAALILMPLLGVIYLMILFVPKPPPTWYNYLIRILYPMQGTLACLVYVVFNGEVRQVMKARWNRWIHTKSEFLERRREIANFLNGEVAGDQQINGGLKRTTVVQSDSHGFISCHIKKELPYDKAWSKLKQNISPTTPVSEGVDPERPLFPTGNHQR